MGVKMSRKNIFYNEIKDTIERVKQRHQRTHIKQCPTYNWHKHWASSNTDLLAVRYSLGVPSPLNKPLRIGGVTIY